MFQLYNQARTALIVTILVVGSAGLCWAKCADVVIHTYGEIIGDLSPDLKLTMEICPSPRRPLPVVPLKNHHFEAETYFDSFIAEDNSRREYCGRMPESIVLVITDGAKEVARVKLVFEKDFVRDESGHYTLREGAKIQIPSH